MRKKQNEAAAYVLSTKQIIRENASLKSVARILDFIWVSGIFLTLLATMILVSVLQSNFNPTAAALFWGLTVSMVVFPLVGKFFVALTASIISEIRISQGS